jgi:hypothetical protein
MQKPNQNFDYRDLREALENTSNLRGVALQSQARTRVTVGRQLGFSGYELSSAKKQTRRDKFFTEIESVVPWQALIFLIEPDTPRTARNAADLPALSLAFLPLVNSSLAPPQSCCFHWLTWMGWKA